MRRLVSRLSPMDRVGLALVVVWIVWAATTSLINGRLLSPVSPYVVAPLMVALGVALGRRIAASARGGGGASDSTDVRRVDAGLCVVTSVFFLWEIVRGGSGGGALGYANANAALAVQLQALVALAVIGAPAHRRRLLRVTLLGAALLGLIIGSRAGTAVALAVLVAIALALWGRVRRRWWGIAVGAAAIATAATGNIRLAGQANWPGWADLAFDETRHQLWADALELWKLHPAMGAGPGAFRQFSPLAADPDTATAHSSVLQVGAETGLVGVVLFAALIAVGFAIAAQGSAPSALVGVAAWSALGVHSFVDHLLEFPLIVLAAGLVLGWAGAHRSEQLDVGQGQRPVDR